MKHFILLALTTGAFLAPTQAALIARYELNETAGPTLNDSVGTNTSATQSGAGFLSNQASIPAGAYGALNLGTSTWGATAGLSGATGGDQRIISRTGIGPGTNGGTREGG